VFDSPLCDGKRLPRGAAHVSRDWRQVDFDDFVKGPDFSLAQASAEAVHRFAKF